MRDLADLRVEAVSLLLVLLSHYLIEGAQTDVGQAVRADDHTGAGGALGGHRDRGEDGRAKRRRSRLLDGVEARLQRILRLADGLCQPLATLRLAVLLQEGEIVQLVTRDKLRFLRAIADHVHLMVKSHDAHLAILGSIRHVINLRVYCRLDTLDTRNVSHIAIGSVHELVGAVAELAHLASELLEMIATQIVLASDGLGHAHRAGYIEAKDDRYVLSTHTPIFHLSRSLEQVSDLV